jgi:thioredoxin 1
MNTIKELKDILTKCDVVVVDCYAPWCGPCKVLSPIMDELENEYRGKAAIIKMDVDENEEIATEFKIRGVPTILFFVKGELKNKITGLNSKQTISAMIDTAIEMTK